MNQKSTIQIFCEINPSEDPEKVRTAVSNIFPEIELEVSDFDISGKTNNIEIRGAGAGPFNQNRTKQQSVA